MYDYLICLDFEATCWQDSSDHEIIEFPSVVVDVKTTEIVDRIEQFVKPKKNVILSDFCRKLTTITQEQVNNGVSLKEALHAHKAFVSKYQNSIIVTCGDWDLKTMLPQDCKFNDIKPSKYYDKWINVKHPFMEMYKPNKSDTGMAGMLKVLGMDFEGVAHRGCDDAFNLARICIQMLRDKWVPEVTGRTK